MGKSVGAREARKGFSKLLKRAQRDEEVVITKNGRPVAKIMPLGPKPRKHDPEAVAQALQRLRELGKSTGIKHFDWKEWKKFRDDGRP